MKIRHLTISLLIFVIPLTSYSCECVALKKGEGDLYHLATYGEGFAVLDRFEMAKLIAERDSALAHLSGKIESIQNSVAFSKQHIYLNEDKLQFSLNEHAGKIKLDKEVLNYNDIQSKIDLLKTQSQTIVFPVVKTIRGKERKSIKANVGNACGVVLKRNSEYEFTILEGNRNFLMNACNTRKVKTPNKFKNENAASGSDASSTRPF